MPKRKLQSDILEDIKLSDDSDEELSKKPVKIMKKQNMELLDGDELKELISSLKMAVTNTSVDLNTIVSQCLISVVPSLGSLLSMPKEAKEKVKSASHSKKWGKYKSVTKSYVMSMYKVLNSASQDTIVEVLVKYCYQLVPFITPFEKASHLYLKKLIEIWSTGSQSNRVVAFLSINRLTMILKKELLDTAMKKMYMAFVKNTKFTSPTTLPQIKFMQKSLAELYARDSKAAYQHAFVYIRQQAIHLRNAVTVTKKETCQAVYNWQFMHALGLWTELLCSCYPNPSLQPLIYPLVQVITGTCKLLPTERYYPLRFHCIRMLNRLSEATKTFIPVIPYLLEVLELTNFNKRRQTANQRAIDFSCLLKFSKSQLNDRAFKDGVMEEVHDLLIETLAVHAHSVAFPELVFPLTVQLKKVLKDTKSPMLSKFTKNLLQRVEDNVAAMTKKRKTAAFKLSDFKAVEAFETRMKQEGMPFTKFYNTHMKKKQAQIKALQGRESEERPTKKRKVEG